MRRSSLVATLLLAACHSAPAPTTATAPTAKPTATAPKVLSFVVITSGRKEGEGEIRVEPDGRRTTHFTFNDRGRGPDLRATISVDDKQQPIALTVTGHDYFKAPVDERLEIAGGALHWKSTGEQGEAPAGTGFYVSLSESMDSSALMVRALRKAPNHRIKLLPAGEAWLEDEQVREVDVAGQKVTLHAVAIAGLGYQPGRFYVDDHDELYAAVSTWTSIIRAGAESAIPTLIADDDAWTNARSAKLAHDLAHQPPAAGLAITHARLFDTVTKKVTDDATIVIAGGKITQVGNAKTKIPAGAQVIDAHGRMVMPGLWDMHAHLSDDGINHLASGVTMTRDLGNDMKSLIERIGRYDAGTEIGPRVVRAGLIDGPGKFTAPIGLVVNTPEEATAAVDKIADNGYVQVKMYSSLSPALVPVIAKAAHAKHLRVSGHIPNGMRASEAVLGGYDEIQHVNMLFLQFLAKPEDDIRTPARFTRVAEGAAGLDLQSPEVQKFLDLLVAHKTVLDPTVSTFQGMFIDDPSDLDPTMAPYADRLPAQVLRSAHGGGLPAPDGKRATYRASFAQMLKLVKLAWDKKLRIVAGTDGPAGMMLANELGLYVEAGIPAPDVLQLATLGAARVMGKDKELGSIAVGKQADLILIDGDPTRDISAIRKVDTVVCRGTVYDAGELFQAIGMRPRAH